MSDRPQYFGRPYPCGLYQVLPADDRVYHAELGTGGRGAVNDVREADHSERADTGCLYHRVWPAMTLDINKAEAAYVWLVGAVPPLAYIAAGYEPAVVIGLGLVASVIAGIGLS